MPVPTRIYLDNAATSWPKPEAVYTAVEHYLRDVGAPAGRGSYREAIEVERLVHETRTRAAQLLGVSESHRLIFTANGTDSLNLALHGLLEPGDHVITTTCEHNSVLRPLRYLEQHRGLLVTRVACSADGVVSPDDIDAAVRDNTKLIAMVHASNVTGALQPVAAVGAIAAEHGVLFLLDAAQSLGHVPVSIPACGSHLVAAPGHKGLLGILGTGLLYVAPGVEEQLLAVRQGGTGTSSENDTQPETLPDKYEAGNLNVPGIISLHAGLKYLAERGLDTIRQQEQQLTDQLLNGLAAIPGVHVFGPRDARKQLGVVSLTIAGYDPQEVAALLDATYGIQVRSGFHCAPLMHAALGTTHTGGTVRLSLGHFNTKEQIDVAIQAIDEIAQAAT